MKKENAHVTIVSLFSSMYMHEQGVFEAISALGVISEVKE